MWAPKAFGVVLLWLMVEPIASVRWTGRALPCTGNGEQLIFDSVILDFVITTEFIEIQKVEDKSAKIELCVIRRVSLIKNFPAPVLRNREGILF